MIPAQLSRSRQIIVVAVAILQRRPIIIILATLQCYLRVYHLDGVRHRSFGFQVPLRAITAHYIIAYIRSFDGAFVGSLLGNLVGILVGNLVGRVVGTSIGAFVGGCLVGVLMGSSVGRLVTSVGEFVGSWSAPSSVGGIVYHKKVGFHCFNHRSVCFIISSIYINHWGICNSGRI